MSHVLSLKLETSSDETRDSMLRSFIAAIETFMLPGDAIVFTLKHERPTARGSRTVTEKVEWECGEPAPTLADFGILTTQHELWSIARRLRDHGIELRVASNAADAAAIAHDTSATETSDASDEQQQSTTDDLTPIERMILGALGEAEQQSDEQDDSDDEQSDEQDDDA